MPLDSSITKQTLSPLLIPPLPVEYIGPFLLENIGVVWNMIHPFLGTGADTSQTCPLDTQVQAATALVSLLHEAPPEALQTHTGDHAQVVYATCEAVCCASQ